MTTITKVKFANTAKSLFFSDLRSQIDAYFSKKNIDKHGGLKLLLKAICMLSMYFVPYVLMANFEFSGLQMWGMSVVMGLGIAGVGMSVMHDAIHGSFSKIEWVNTVFGASLYFLGGNVYNWSVQHNKLHHTYTNIHGIDEDVTGKPILRLSFSEKLKSIHKYQKYYAPFLYSLMTFSFLYKDFKEIGLYNRLNKTGIVKSFSAKELMILFASKVFYIAFIFVFPIYVFKAVTFGEWFIGFSTMHIIAGLILAFVFQLAHIVDGTHHPEPNESGTIENAWAIHQLETTANFAGGNKLLSWYIGGLDYQVEHHLFPHISHIHYPALSKIVEDTARKYNIIYNNKNNIVSALASHFRMLNILGTHQKCPLG
ncbi:MAG: fatty acid desaturase family protein [Leadbetterella sp.]